MKPATHQREDTHRPGPPPSWPGRWSPRSSTLTPSTTVRPPSATASGPSTSISAPLAMGAAVGDRWPRKRRSASSSVGTATPAQGPFGGQGRDGPPPPRGPGTGRHAVTQRTRSGPRVSWATLARKAESAPPLKATTTPSQPAAARPPVRCTGLHHHARRGASTLIWASTSSRSTHGAGEERARTPRVAGPRPRRSACGRRSPSGRPGRTPKRVTPHSQSSRPVSR